MNPARYVQFGLGARRKLSGAECAVRVFQISSLLPLLYLFLVTGYPALITARGLFSALFDLGVSALPRLEALALSWLYRETARELLVYFAILGLALAWGLAAAPLLRGTRKTALWSRQALAAWIGLDLALRLLPLPFNASFGTAAAVCGFVLRAGCLALILLDLRADKKKGLLQNKNERADVHPGS